MSLAPASSRGFFLKARLAVNGIQCAARSFGTLTAGRGGLLSSMGGLSGFLDPRVGRQAISFAVRRERQYAVIFCAQSGEVGRCNPEDFCLRILGVEPQQRQL